MKTPLYLFPGGKPKAVTFSYDDGVLQDERLVNVLNRYGLKGTFNINSGMDHRESHITLSEENVKRIYGGHEIACHAEYHAGMDRCSATDAMREIWNDRMKLEKVSGQMVTGFAYPCGQYSGKVVEILRLAGIEYARTTENSDRSRYIPDDFLLWKPSCHHRDALNKMDAFLDEKRLLLQIFYIWGHSYEFDRDDNWELLDKICEKISGHDDIWYATNIEICRYIKAIRSQITSANGNRIYNPTAQTVWFANGWEADKISCVKPGETVEF